MKRIRISFASNLHLGLCLGLCLALGGCTSGSDGAPPPPPPAHAVRLAYTDPSEITRWRLVRSPLSTDTQLLLDLHAPDGAAGRGVTCTLTLGGGVQWKPLEGMSYTKNLAYTESPSAITRTASVKGRSLRILHWEPLGGSPKAYGQAPVLRVSMALNAGSAPGKVNLTASGCGHLGTGKEPEAFSLSIGTLELK